MKTTIIRLCKRTLTTIANSPIFDRARRGQLTILMYHGVIDQPMRIPDWCMINVDAFRDQMKYLKKHYKVVNLSEAAQLITNNAITEPTAVITFDDGYQNNHDLAYPILKEEKLPATLFISTAFIDTDKTIWTGMLHTAFSVTRLHKLDWEGQSFDLSDAAARAKSLATVKTILKNRPQDSLRTNVDSILQSLNDGQPLRIEHGSPYRMLDSKSIISLINSGVFEIGAHTHSHYVLSRIPVELQEFEISKSLDTVRSYTGNPCRIFAYPNGTHADYNSDTLNILKKAGVTTAVITESGLCNRNSPPLELRRISVGSADGMNTFRLSLVDIAGFFHRLTAKST